MYYLVQVRVSLPLEVRADVLAPGAQICPDEPSNIPSLPAAEVGHAPQRVCANDVVPENMYVMLVTLDTSHFDKSPLNDVAE